MESHIRGFYLHGANRLHAYQGMELWINDQTLAALVTALLQLREAHSLNDENEASSGTD